MDKVERIILLVGFLTISTLIYFRGEESIAIAFMPAGFVFIALVVYRQQKKRKQKLEKFCVEHKWRKLSRKDELRLSSPYHSTQFYELAGKILDMPAQIIEGKHGLGKNAPTVLAIAVKAHVPEFKISAETLGNRIAQKLGFEDIDFSDDKKFSERYRLIGGNPQVVRDFFRPRLRQYMLENPPTTTIFGRDRWLYFCYDETFHPEQALEHIDSIKKFLEHNKLTDSTGQP